MAKNLRVPRKMEIFLFLYVQLLTTEDGLYSLELGVPLCASLLATVFPNAFFLSDES
jgi:hypothetical protein